MGFLYKDLDGMESLARSRATSLKIPDERVEKI